jgi:hypothetical protein
MTGSNPNINGEKMNCRIYQTCPYAANCSIVMEAEFCAHHQQNASEDETFDHQGNQFDFIPEEE